MQNSLPLKWFRLPLLLTTVGLSAVTIAVGIQAVRGINRLEHKVMTEGSQEGIDFMFKMTDVKSVSIVLTVIAFLIGLSSLTFAISLASDWLSRLSNATPRTKVPFSTRTLRAQTVVLSFLSLWILTVLIPTTVFVRTRSAKVVSSTMMNAAVLATDRVYWDYGFLRCLGAAPWFTLIFAAPAALATICAFQMTKTLKNIPNKGISEDKA